MHKSLIADRRVVIKNRFHNLKKVLKISELGSILTIQQPIIAVDFSDTIIKTILRRELMSNLKGQPKSWFLDKESMIDTKDKILKNLQNFTSLLKKQNDPFNLIFCKIRLEDC